MNIRQPFPWLPHAARKRGFWIAVVVTVVVLVSLNVAGAPLNTSAAPAGIISFEFAGSISVAREMMDSWDENGLVLAAVNLGIDFLLLVAYSLAISLGCVLIAGRVYGGAGVAAAVGIILAWAQFAAAALDAVENYALIRVLLASSAEPRPAADLWPVLARACAFPKFAIVGAGLLYLFVGQVLMPIAGRRTRRDRIEGYRGKADLGMSTDEILSQTRPDPD